MTRQPQSTTELMTAAAEALTARDPDRLDQLMRLTWEWLQPADEAEAQREMLEAMMVAADELRRV